MQRLLDFIKSESGETAVEYGLIAALIGVIALSALVHIGKSISDTFGKHINDGFTGGFGNTVGNISRTGTR